MRVQLSGPSSIDRVYPVLFIDAILIKVRDGQVTNRRVYVAICFSTGGERAVLGLWAGDGNAGLTRRH